MEKKVRTVAEQRRYSVLNVKSAKQVCLAWLQQARLEKAIAFGLPEVDDRYHFWRVPLLNKASKERIGEAVIDARTSLLLENKSTTPAVLEARLLGRNGDSANGAAAGAGGSYALSSLRNTIAAGDSEEVLQDLPAGSVDLVFTSPPYYNARPEYTDYITYEEYLLKIRKVIQHT
ncbi:MAG TPA: site-specific DNA-methyltransferase, partial [Blastocatellia bacterium]|nr:site-specific DNA-methyltransferase [Blastocatellia bacterium]